MRYLLLILFIILHLGLYAQNNTLFKSSRDSIASLDSLIDSWYQNKEKVISSRQYNGEGNKSLIEQFENFKNNSSKYIESYMSKNGLRLVGFDTVFSDFLDTKDSVFVLVDGDNHKFILSNNDNLIECQQQNFLKVLHVKFFQKCDANLAISKFQWLYNGQNIETNCIVSMKYNCLVYDPIISNLHFITETTTIKEPDGKTTTTTVNPDGSTTIETTKQN